MRMLTVQPEIAEAVEQAVYLRKDAQADYIAALNSIVKLETLRGCRHAYGFQVSTYRRPRSMKQRSASPIWSMSFGTALEYISGPTFNRSETRMVKIFLNHRSVALYLGDIA
jgi:hypothetical protein